MVGQVELKVDGELRNAPALEVEDELRRGLLPPDTLVHFPPWTGEVFRRADQVPALQGATDSRESRLAAHLLAPRVPWLTALLLVGLALGGWAQFALADLLAAEGGRWVHWMAVGWESTLVDGAWWTPWSALLVHASFLHLIGNLAIVGYCGYRVERAIGKSGLLAAAAGAVLGGSAAVVGFSERPVVGASLLAFGLWGAQFAIGFRYGNAIPARLRGVYGLGTAVVTLPLLALSLFGEHASFLGHLGGWLGGATAAMVVSPASTAPRALARRAGLLRAIFGLGLALVPCGLALAAGRSPELVLGDTLSLHDERAGARLTLPWRMALHRDAPFALAGWSPGPAGRSPMFLDRTRSSAPLTLASRQADWAARTGLEVRPIAATLARSGYTAFGWQLSGSDGARMEVQEVVRPRGYQRLAIGFVTEVPLGAARRLLYDVLVAGVEWEESEELARRRSRASAHPGDAEAAFAYAWALEVEGETDTAFRRYAALAEGEGDWPLRVARAQMRLCSQPDAPGQCNARWRTEWLAREPDDEKLGLSGLRWLARDGDCDTARGIASRLMAAGRLGSVEAQKSLLPCPD